MSHSYRRRLCGSNRAVFETDAPERCTLLSSHVRKGGETTPHVCNICLTRMYAKRNYTPSWVQAPCCAEVWHESCILRYTREAQDDTFTCPQCKTKHTLASVNDWDASDVVDKLFPDVDYAPDASDTDNDTHTAPQRHTRSQGAPEELKRRTRSSGVYV